MLLNWYSVIGEGACAYPQQGRRLKGQVPLETSRQPIGGQQKSVRSRGSGSPWQRHTRAVNAGEEKLCEIIKIVERTHHNAIVSCGSPF